MPSYKQKKERKKSHKHKHSRNRSRSSLRRQNVQRKNEGKKENIPHNASSWDEDLRDISSYMEDRREMVKQMFSSVGEEVIRRIVPLILKQRTREQLKRTCFKELTRMSADVVFKILEGIPCDAEPNISSKDCSKKRKPGSNSSKSCSGYTLKYPSVESCCRINKGCEELKLSKGEDEGHSCDEKSETSGSSSPEESQSDSETEESKNSEDDVPDTKCEGPSTSYQPSINKKLAKVAPFHISISMPEVPQPAALAEGNIVNRSDIDNETSCEMVDLGLEEDIDDGENDRVSQGHEVMDEILPHVSSTLDENSDSQESAGEEVQQNSPEVLELEHRARAIRSMLANIDRLQA